MKIKSLRTYRLNFKLWFAATKSRTRTNIDSYLSLQYQRDLFTDTVSGNRVMLYKDCYGKYWQKDSRWSFFRVEYDNCK